ncbi:uncharacterized protein LAJ45_04664 [Morchella importuna]|uniref:uncharacterized protein n=1 Tax=Morchella importuna TaxID=1174673 RepID=UPI001E8E762F|nr:uncharacterized protein LAJ45_04664 [Morchella importuna]KAH8151459.1 hypothetical protein LAJ45_04664 [Morchella importuna]
MVSALFKFTRSGLDQKSSSLLEVVDYPPANIYPWSMISRIQLVVRAYRDRKGSDEYISLNQRTNLSGPKSYSKPHAP